MKEFLYAQWSKPVVANPPPRSIIDWLLVSALIVAAVVEGFIREDLWLPGLAVVMGIAASTTLLWRRSSPLGAILVAFSIHAASEIIPALAGETSLLIYSGAAYALLLPYSLLRWGSGRHSAFGLAFIVATHMFAHPLTLADVALVVVFFVFPAEVGASVRHRVEVRRKLIDQVRFQERQELARELHDTVAHHVSAIVVRAQAGQVQARAAHAPGVQDEVYAHAAQIRQVQGAPAPAGSDLLAAMETMAVIEREAARALGQMRSMVGVLRSDDVAELTPQPGVADLAQFARDDEVPRIKVEVSTRTGQPATAVGAAIYRMAQESITNALRHARRPHEIKISVDGDRDCVRLLVHDDGEHPAPASGASGYGIVGMQERARLLGGTLEAGPAGRGRGWKVEAVLPRLGLTR